MKIKNIIFSNGFDEMDDIEMEEYHGIRSDILVEDIKGYFYALGFKSLSQVKPCPYGLRNIYVYTSDEYYVWHKKKNGKHKIETIPNAFRYWLIVIIVNVKIIFETIDKLNQDNFFINLEPIPKPTKKEKKRWKTIGFNNYKNSKFYLNLYPNENYERK